MRISYYIYVHLCTHGLHRCNINKNRLLLINIYVRISSNLILLTYTLKLPICNRRLTLCMANIFLNINHIFTIREHMLHYSKSRLQSICMITTTYTTQQIAYKLYIYILDFYKKNSDTP